MTIILYPDGHAEIECDQGERIVADGSGKKLTEAEAVEMAEALREWNFETRSPHEAGKSRGQGPTSDGPQNKGV